MAEDSLPQWNSNLHSYRTVVSVRFHTNEDRRRATQLFWRKSHALYGVPRDFLDAKTLAMPEEAVKYLRVEGIKFTSRPTGAFDDLTPTEQAEMRAVRNK